MSSNANWLSSGSRGWGRHNHLFVCWGLGARRHPRSADTTITHLLRAVFGTFHSSDVLQQLRRVVDAHAVLVSPLLVQEEFAEGQLVATVLQKRIVRQQSH